MENVFKKSWNIVKILNLVNEHTGQIMQFDEFLEKILKPIEIEKFN